MEGTVVKAKIGELEEEVRVGSLRGMRKELTGMVQGVHQDHSPIPSAPPYCQFCPPFLIVVEHRHINSTPYVF